MGDFGMKITKDGADFGTALAQDLVFSSSYPIYKVVYAGSLTLSVGSSSSGDYVSSFGTFTHGLGYFPSFRAYTVAQDASISGKRKMLDTIDFPTVGSSAVFLHGRVTTNDFIAVGDNKNGLNYSYTINYLIFADKSF